MLIKSSCKVSVCQDFWNSCRGFPHCAMSRCFPFPPPGYEKKSTTNDIDFLKKERRKEKKHKKDKKDREKREGKEKREERSDVKHREKKEKKDKHRDKKKDKEKRVEGQFGNHNGELFNQNNNHNKQKDESSSSLQPRNGEHREQLKENCSSSYDKRSSVQLHGQNQEILVNNNSKFVQELSRRIRDDEKRTGSLQFPVDSRETSVDRGEILKTDRQRITNEATFGIQEIDERHGVLRKIKDLEKGRTNEKDKNKPLKNSDTVGFVNNLSTNCPNQRVGGELKKRKDMGTNGFTHDNECRSNKMARPTTILTENGRKQDFLENGRPSQQGSFKVDSQQKVNGIIPSKPMSIVPKKPPISSKPTVTKLPPVTTNHIAATQPPPPPPPSVPKVAPPPLSGSKKKPQAEPPLRPPHPDTKYLKQILTVPKFDQWSDIVDQEWLLSRKVNTHFKKTIEDDSLRDNREAEVWSEAKQLESVDICALPYVIPF